MPDEVVQTKEPPRCPIHGFVMVQQFRDEQVNEHTTYAVPTGKYVCFRCEELRAAHRLGVTPDAR